jgi:hypothetical protein
MVGLMAGVLFWTPPLAAQAINGAVMQPPPSAGTAQNDPDVFRRAAEETKERLERAPKTARLRTRADEERERRESRVPSK